MKWLVLVVILLSFLSASYLVESPFKKGQCIYEIDRHEVDYPKVPFRELT